MTYASERLVEEVAYVAYHLHWPLDDILDLEHPLRRSFIASIGALNDAAYAAEVAAAATGSGA